MLTKQDLQSIKEIVNGSIDERVPEIIDKKLRPLKRDIRSIKKDVSVLIDRSDRADVLLQKRVTKLERHTGIGSN